MKKLVIGAFCVLVASVGYLVIYPMLTKTSCGTEHLKTATTEVSLRDRVFLALSMKSRFGKTSKYFSKRVKSANNVMIYKTDKKRPWLSVFTAEFRHQSTANKASRQLKRLHRSNEKEQFHVTQNGKSVSLYSNHRYDDQCFFEVVKLHTGKDASPDRMVAKTPKAKPVKKKVAKKKTVKKKAKKRKTRKKIAKKKKKRRAKKVSKRKSAKKRRKSTKKKTQRKNRVVAKKN